MYFTISSLAVSGFFLRSPDPARALQRWNSQALTLFHPLINFSMDSPIVIPPSQTPTQHITTFKNHLQIACHITDQKFSPSATICHNHALPHCANPHSANSHYFDFTGRLLTCSTTYPLAIQLAPHSQNLGHPQVQ